MTEVLELAGLYADNDGVKIHYMAGCASPSDTSTSTDTDDEPTGDAIGCG